MAMSWKRGVLSEEGVASSNWLASLRIKPSSGWSNVECSIRSLGGMRSTRLSLVARSRVEKAERREFGDHRADGEPALFEQVHLGSDVSRQDRRGRAVSAHELVVQRYSRDRYRQYLLRRTLHFHESSGCPRQPLRSSLVVFTNPPAIRPARVPRAGTGWIQEHSLWSLAEPGRAVLT